MNALLAGPQPERAQPSPPQNPSESTVIPVGLPRFRVVAETADYLVVDKPPFLETHPSKPGGRFTLWDGLRELLAFEIVNGGQVSIINRLDRETSGLTLIAKHRESARRFHLLMTRKEITKEYLALTWGWPPADEFTVNAPLLRKGEREKSAVYVKRMVHPDGVPALTRFRVEKRFTRQTSNGSQFALLRAIPKTGRTHQIRAHLKHAGFPIVGDKIYGPSEAAYLEFIRTGWTARLAADLVLPRHALHSTVLRIAREQLEWHAPLPENLASWL